MNPAEKLLVIDLYNTPIITIRVEKLTHPKESAGCDFTGWNAEISRLCPSSGVFSIGKLVSSWLIPISTTSWPSGSRTGGVSGVMEGRASVRLT